MAAATPVGMGTRHRNEEKKEGIDEKRKPKEAACFRHGNSTWWYWPHPQDPHIPLPLLLPENRGSRQRTAISGSMMSTLGAGRGREHSERKGHLTS